MRRFLMVGFVGAAALLLVACSGGDGKAPSAGPPATPATTGAASSPTAARQPGSGGGGTGSGQGQVRWEFNGSSWQAFGTAPACPNPLALAAPVDMAKVTSILYPGQARGGDYKPHGGFRFDGPGQANEVAVTAPLDAQVVRGSRYLVNGEVQYSFDFINSCGLMYRLGHLRELSPRFAAFAASFPPAVENDSRTTNVPSGQTVKAGEAVATAIGIRADRNVFVDFGFYDLRVPNAASKDASWLTQHPGELAAFAICWFDNLPPADAATVRKLPPADPASGTKSDVCR